MKKQFDVIIIGSGVAGMALASGLHEAGKTIAVVEEALWGGTCPNRGCDPKKVLLSAIDAREAVTLLKGNGFTETPSINWHDLMQFKKSFTDPIPKSNLDWLNESGITAITGQAQFIDAEHIQVNRQTYQAKQFILATGQHPAIPDIKGKELFKTSNDFLSLDSLPQKIVFLGAGYIAFELASIANACGAEVHIVQHDDKPLKAFDSEFVDALVEQLTSSGVIFHFGESAEVLEQQDTHYVLKLKSGKALEGDLVLSTAGRVPNIESLQLENARVAYNKKGIVVDEYLTTSCKTIFACGDCIDKNIPRLTPISAFEGDYLVRFLTAQTPEKIAYPATPTVIFTPYRLGQVGITSQTAANNPDKYAINSINMTGWLSYKRRQEAVAKAKIITDKQTGLMVGATVISQEADELINFFTLIINERIPAERIRAMIMLFPTIGSDLASLY